MSGGFNWHASGLDHAHFTATANLFALMTGQTPGVQIEPSSEEPAVQARAYAENRADENGPWAIDLKKRFLDRLAELLSTEKGGTHVACTIMREGPAGVTIWIARNKGFHQNDLDFFQRFERYMSELARGESAHNAKKSLWKSMLSYYTPRLSHYLSSIMASFQGDMLDIEVLPTVDAPSGDRSLKDELVAFRSLVRLSSQTDIRTIVEVAYRIRQMGPFSSDFLGEWSKDTNLKVSSLESLFERICYLGRLGAAFATFKRAAKLGAFRTVTLVAITSDGGNEISPPPPEPLSRTLRRLGVKWFKGDNNHFRYLQQKTLHIHAEIILLIYLATHNVDESQLFGYIGCSKLSCYSCSTFLRKYGDFITRGCHGKLYPRWTVPDVPDLPVKSAYRFLTSLKYVQDELERKFRYRTAHDRAQHPASPSIASVTDTADRETLLSPSKQSMIREEAKGTSQREVPISVHDADEVSATSPATRAYIIKTLTENSPQPSYHTLHLPEPSDESSTSSSSSSASTMKGVERTEMNGSPKTDLSHLHVAAVNTRLPDSRASTPYRPILKPKTVSAASSAAGAPVREAHIVNGEADVTLSERSYKSRSKSRDTRTTFADPPRRTPRMARRSRLTMDTFSGESVSEAFFTAVHNCRYHDAKLCILLHSYDNPNSSSAVKKAIASEIQDRIRRLKLKYSTL